MTIKDQDIVEIVRRTFLVYIIFFGGLQKNLVFGPPWVILARMRALFRVCLDFMVWISKARVMRRFHSRKRRIN